MGAEEEVKISDFGLSVADRTLLKLDKLKSMPVKWLAPETVEQGLFSKKSDVWSFGVLMWEIFHKCEADPYHGIPNKKAKEIIKKGGELTMPEGTDSLAVSTMALCHTLKADDRPDFNIIFAKLAPDEKPPVNDNLFDTYAT